MEDKLTAAAGCDKSVFPTWVGMQEGAVRIITLVW